MSKFGESGGQLERDKVTEIMLKGIGKAMISIKFKTSNKGEFPKLSFSFNKSKKFGTEFN